MAGKNNVTTENLKFYDVVRQVPSEAIKKISGGRLNGMSDINPVWRIRVMTETFGPCGLGWKYEITKQWQEQFGQEVKCFTNINLYVKVNDVWSDPIPGTGGATLVEVNSRGLYVSDEGYKMSLTDALSVAMKSLGVAADVYFEKGKNLTYDTKYSQQSYIANENPVTQPKPELSASTEELQAAFEMIKQNIENAPSRKYLDDLHIQNVALHNYKPYRDAMNKRVKELANGAKE